MPKVTINDTKGLYQESGSGIVVHSKGARGVIVSAETALPVATGNTDIRFEMPAGALVTDFGFVVTSAVGGGSGSGTMAVLMGTTAAGGELVASATVADANSTIAAGASMSVINAVEADATGAPFADFVDASALHSTSARNLFARFTQGGGSAAAIGKVIAYIEYIVIK